MSDSRTFADGFSFKRSEKAPDFVIGRMSIKIDDAVKFMKENGSNGWINLQVKQARSGNYYVELDNYEAKGTGAAPTAQPKPMAEPSNDDLPF
jgi:hypothetical protein